jgi:hypothetical protein
VVLGALSSALALLLLGGCGSSGSSTASTTSANAATAPSTAVVPIAEVKRNGPGTVQNTALRWWRAAQLNEPKAAIGLYAAPPTEANLAGQFNLVVGQLGGMVKVVSVKPRGKQAIATIAWQRPGVPLRTVTLPMERRGGKWKITRTLFLDLLVQQIQGEAAAQG